MKDNIGDIVAKVMNKLKQQPPVVLIAIGVLYALSPIDLLPDFIAGIGWLDDMAVLFALFKAYKDRDNDTELSA